MSENEIKHKENHHNGLFYIKDENGILCELTYKLEEGVMIIDHTETRRSREGEGWASKLLEAAVSFAREQDYKVNPLCPFAEVKFDENEKYQEIRA